MQQNNFKKGFTLVELLVVISIIGFLSTVILVGFSGLREKTRDIKRVGVLDQTQKALETYYLRYKYYPNISQGGTCEVQTCTNGDGWETLRTILQNEGLMNSLPAKSDGYIYCSDKTSNSQEYVLKSVLETNYEALNGPNDFDGYFYTDWSCDDLACSDGARNFCLVNCQNVSGLEGPSDESMNPPNCGTY
jgi:prepilin-type N-terminal cleavage/methylation domain-containing protein